METLVFLSVASVGRSLVGISNSEQPYQQPDSGRTHFFFSQVHACVVFTKRDHIIMGYKTNLNIFIQVEIIQNVIYDNIINNKSIMKCIWKIPKYFAIKQHTSNNPRSKRNLQIFRKYFEMIENENTSK